MANNWNKYLSSKLAKLEGKKSQVKIGDMREVVKLFMAFVGEIRGVGYEQWEYDDFMIACEDAYRNRKSLNSKPSPKRARAKGKRR